MTIEEASVIGLIAFVAGMMGGLAGIGGSIFILPALHIAFGPMFFGEPVGRPQIHHMYMAAAMTVNVAVSIPAAIQHYRASALRLSLLPVLLPTTSVAMVLGVLLSNRIDGGALEVTLAVFLLLYCAWNLRVIMRPRRRAFEGTGRIENTSRARLAACGSATGLVGGTLGLGGGFMLVPLLQLVCNLRLKNAIATSSAVLCVTAAVGAALKMATLPQHGEAVRTALVYALVMAPTGVLGAWAGAKWLHQIPPTGVRIIMTLLILAAATRLIH